MRRWLWLVVLAACGGDDDGSDAALEDASIDGGIDASIDAGVDAPLFDVGVDAGGLVAVPRPAPPVFPDTIGTLTVELRTAEADNSQTDDPLEVCLSASRCFRLDTPDVNDFRQGDIDVFQIEGVAMPRSEVDRVTLQTASTEVDNDRFTPSCLALRFDGEPMYCNDVLPNHIGTGPSAGEVPAWTDPMGLHEACVTCEERGIITHGTVLGAPGDESVRVWTRTDATRDVALMLAIPGTDPVPVAWARPRPESDYNVVLEVDGLDPATTYEYYVELDEARTGAIPVTTTSDEQPSLRFAFGSCSQELAQPVFGPLAMEDLDLFFFVGDIHYGNTRYAPAHRWEYRRFRSIPGRRGFLAGTPTMATWDDHDFVGNNSDGGCIGKEEALASFREAWPNPAFGIDGTPGAFMRHRMGPVELFLTDCRYHKPRVADPGRNCDEGPAPTDTAGGPLGSAQYDWLLAGLSESTAPFKVVACGSLFTSTAGVDSWASFPAGRDRFMSELASAGIEGVVLASGDIHRSEIRDYPRAGAYTLTELVSSPLAQYARDANPGRGACGGSDAAFCYHWDSYITVEATTDTMNVEVHDEVGDVVYERQISVSDLR